MKTNLILLKSQTEASKAKYFLDRLQINSVVEKTHERKGGCAYGIRVSEDTEYICAKLSEIKVTCREIR